MKQDFARGRLADKAANTVPGNDWQAFAGIAGLRLEALPAEGTRIETVTVNRARALGDLFTPCRRTRRRVETGLTNPFSRPMSVEEVADALGLFAPDHRRVFERYLRQFSHADTPVRLDVPAYDLGRGRLLLLDGEHRVTALFMADVPCQVRLAVLHGPIDRLIFPDLRYWDGGFLRMFRQPIGP